MTAVVDWVDEHIIFGKNLVKSIIQLDTQCQIETWLAKNKFALCMVWCSKQRKIEQNGSKWRYLLLNIKTLQFANVSSFICITIAKSIFSLCIQKYILLIMIMDLTYQMAFIQFLLLFVWGFFQDYFICNEKSLATMWCHEKMFSQHTW